MANSKSLALTDLKAPTWPTSIDGETLLDRSLIWATSIWTIEPVKNSPILILMRLGISSTSLFLGACLAGLFPIIIKPTTPVKLIIEAVRKSSCALVAVPAAWSSELSLHGFSCVCRKEDFVIMRSPHASLPHPDVNGAHLVGIHSSGSTGAPNVAVHTLDRIINNAAMHANSINLSPDDTVALTLPLSFSAGLVAGLMSTLLSEAKGIFVDTQKINAHAILDSAPVSICMGTPATISSLYTDIALKKARIVTVGGDVMNYRLARNLIDRCGRDTKIFSTYGMTEAGPRICISPVTAERLDYYQAVPLGSTLEGVELRIKTFDNQADLGELYVTTPTAMFGYLHSAHGTASSQRRSFGEIRTGDIFRKVSDELIFSGRSSRLIVRGGENISPILIESAIIQNFDFEDVWVTAEHDELLGQVPKAYVTGTQPINVRALTKTLRQHLPTSHIPVIWEITEKIPDHAKK